ncbi:Autophagy protein 7 [Cichlidogyrus casuarinus]|uniref:Ubiquitin-like modifier-activating enzyme ATG7 n=1 Tax=Cichlidogyrus casuarinus TaxID=1844966 RepID=A0ABD2QCE1_9PLAT
MSYAQVRDALTEIFLARTSILAPALIMRGEREMVLELVKYVQLQDECLIMHLTENSYMVTDLRKVDKYLLCVGERKFTNANEEFLLSCLNRSKLLRPAFLFQLTLIIRLSNATKTRLIEETVQLTNFLSLIHNALGIWTILLFFRWALMPCENIFLHNIAELTLILNSLLRVSNRWPMPQSVEYLLISVCHHVLLLKPDHQINTQRLQILCRKNLLARKKLLREAAIKALVQCGGPILQGSQLPLRRILCFGGQNDFSLVFAKRIVPLHEYFMTWISFESKFMQLKGPQSVKLATFSTFVRLKMDDPLRLHTLKCLFQDIKPEAFHCLTSLLDFDKKPNPQFDDQLIDFISCSNFRNSWKSNDKILKNLKYARFFVDFSITESKRLRVLCYRERFSGGVTHNDHSLLLHVTLAPIRDINEFKFVGWEKHKKKSQFRRIDLAASMDPVKLAEMAVSLNLKLMLWRVMPSLNLSPIRDAKCLLLGAGTLGCNVARQLLSDADHQGWGIQKITLVDNGKVSYSNPVRQSLFKFSDSVTGENKAVAASCALKEIYPGVDAEAHNFTIPMPGHCITNALLDEEANQALIKAARDSCDSLKGLIAQHDVVFLLLDTREARWLPSLLATHLGKITVNAALGFDSYLVMRHGVASKLGTSPSAETVESGNSCETVLGSNLGCYFCNDVVAPSDSTRGRAMDQQCTVTRPGASMMASATAVELCVSILQHPLRGRAPAETANENSSHFGFIPHQIRGFLSSYSIMLPAVSAFSNCSACSQVVLDAYAKDDFQFLLRVFQDSDYLEQISGLKQLQNQALTDDSLMLEELTDDDLN